MAPNLAALEWRVHSTRTLHRDAAYPSVMRHSLVTAAVLLVALGAPALQAQGWQTVHQGATWVNAFVDQGISERSALWFDGHWRRDGLGDRPQQLLLRPGVQFALRPGLRAGGGYAYIATAPYGEAPIADPAREHRLWQQLSLAHRVGGLTLSHRLRWEQRWLAPVLDDGTALNFAYQQRARYFVRAQRPLGGLTVSERPVLGFVWDEVFLPVGHSDARFRRQQNRLGVGVGLPLDARQRVEVGYMHQWLRVTSKRALENNHTLVLSWVWTAAR